MAFFCSKCSGHLEGVSQSNMQGSLVINLPDDQSYPDSQNSMDDDDGLTDWSDKEFSRKVIISENSPPVVILSCGHIFHAMCYINSFVMENKYDFRDGAGNPLIRTPESVAKDISENMDKISKLKTPCSVCEQRPLFIVQPSTENGSIFINPKKVKVLFKSLNYVKESRLHNIFRSRAKEQAEYVRMSPIAAGIYSRLRYAVRYTKSHPLEMITLAFATISILLFLLTLYYYFLSESLYHKNQKMYGICKPLMSDLDNCQMQLSDCSSNYDALASRRINRYKTNIL
ncbi:hypothetical protein [Pelagibaculum spongiae]|uniref:Uncharacterized protein n=1 Tax=Pelagibaculum spongiae TaxID=2080658 RepID=A0A2V1GQ78_9GAMM|nr:hypothetical protein [Pelagibaculum spongiae]PVZ64981.1 hypothetical protein DC094_19165 [Pelagibaculum spongiae]